MKLTIPARTTAAFLLGWLGCGSLLALLTFLRTEEALAGIRATTDPIIRLGLQASFDEARIAFLSSLLVGVGLPLALMAAGFAFLTGTGAARRSKPLPK